MHVPIKIPTSDPWHTMSFMRSLACFMLGAFSDSQCMHPRYCSLKLLDMQYSVEKCRNIASRFCYLFYHLTTPKNAGNFGNRTGLQLHGSLQISPMTGWKMFLFHQSTSPLMKPFMQWGIKLGFGSTTRTSRRISDLLYKSLNDARFLFTYQIIPYSGKPVDGDGPYYLKATEDYVKNLVESIPGRNLKGRNISMDRLYTSIPTTNWLLSREITVVGTLQSNRLGLPDELKNPKDWDEFQSTIHWEKGKGNIALCAYTTKSKSKGNKNVLVLSTVRPLLGVTKDDGKCKPTVIKFYDFTKGDTDVMDIKVAKYSCKALTHRWTMVHFYFLLDAIRCNTLSLFAVKHGKSLRAVDSFESCWDLVMNLVTPFISERPLTGLSIGLKIKISTQLCAAFWRFFQSRQLCTAM